MQFSFGSRLFNWWVRRGKNIAQAETRSFVKNNMAEVGWCFTSLNHTSHGAVIARAGLATGHPPVKQFTKNCVTVVCSRGRLFNWWIRRKRRYYAFGKLGRGVSIEGLDIKWG